MRDDVDLALRKLEAQDRESAASHRVATKSVEFVRGKMDAVRSGSEKAVDFVERGGVSYVESASALGRSVQGAVADDAFLALEYFGQVAASNSAAEVFRAHAAYVRAQTRVGLERWHAIAVAMSNAAEAVAQRLDQRISRFDR